VLTWAGPMTIRPIDTDTPPQLTADDATLTLHADEGKEVAVRDPARGLAADAGTLTYHATRAVLAMSPASEQPVVVSIDDAGTGRFASVDADLRAGEITLPGPATAESRTGAALAWSQTATLRLQTDPQGRLTDRLTSADFSGSVTAAQEGGSIQSETLATRFAIGSDARSALRTAVITNGSMSGEPDATGQPNTLAASAIKVDFAGDAGNPEPVRVQADGTVRAASAGSTLEADRAVATLARNDNGETIVRTADASGQVRYTDDTQTSARADTIRVDGIRETVRLTGPDTSVAQGDSSVTGPIIDLDARARRMSVEGAGRFDHTLRDADNNPAGRVLARWTESMRFDDALGKLACRGDVSVVSTPDASTRDTLSAQRVEVEMTPHPVRDPVGGRGNRERQVTLARAFGGTSGDTPTPATIETRRYDPANPERVTGLLYLESDQIVADAERSLLRVPSAGTLLVLDRRPEADQPQDASSPADALGGSARPGLTRFTWQGSMELDRAAGIATMDDTVLVRHKTIDPDASGQARVAELACDTLTASFRELTGQAPDAAANPSPNPDTDPAINPAGSFVLDRADALGSVVFRAAGKELLADGARFEAATDTLHALASPGRTVTLIEPGRPTPVSAGAIMWDLRRDRIEINKPSPVTLPN
jgi:lipopolysaccharide export system protein LptA